MSLEEKTLKRMSDLLRSGATMTAAHCPACNSPLFEINNQLRCPSCNKPVIIVREGEEEKTVASIITLKDLEQTIISRLFVSNQELKEEKNPSRIIELGTTVNMWLTALERIRRIQREAG